MSPPDDSSTPWRIGTPHDALVRFTALLGTFDLKESDGNEQDTVQKALVPRHDALMKFLSEEVTEESPLSFPCLSLVTEDEEGTEGVERSEVQAKAVLSMARSLTPSCGKTPRMSHVEPRGNSTQSNVAPPCKCHTHSPSSDMNPAEVPGTMLSNLAASFALLVDARLRAYTTILALHGVTLAVSPNVEHKEEAIRAVEQKLENLTDIGSRISIDNMVTNFQPQSKLGMSRCVEDNVDELMMPIIFSGVLDITVPKETTGHERVTVSLQAAGAILATCDKGSTLLKSVHLEIDTQQLMSAMMRKADKVSSIALDHVNDLTCRHVSAAMKSIKTALPDETIRGESFKRKYPPADSSLPVVSPDYIATLPPNRPTPLALDDDDDGPMLTVECCASIVDGCIGPIKDDEMISPLLKKRKVEVTSSVTAPPPVL